MPCRVTAGSALMLVSIALILCPACRPPQTSDKSQSPVERRTRSSAPLRDYVRDPLPAAMRESKRSLEIVSLAPVLTEICCALGLRESIVGRTSYCKYPPEISSVPALGALTDLNAELLLRLQPDLILVSGQSRAQTEPLARLGLRFESVPDTGLEDVFAAIDRVGELTGRTEAAAELISAIRSDLDAVQKRYANVVAARVLILTATLSDPPAPPFVGGAGSFYDELLHLAGHTNAAAAGRAFAPLSLEFILRNDPDVIIELDARASGARDDARALEVWRKIGPLGAVANRRVRVLTGPQHYLLGPRIAETFRQICAAIAGESLE